MDCGHIRDQLLAGSLEGLGEHLDVCSPCAELALGGGQLARTLAELPAQAEVNLVDGFERLRAVIAADRGVWGRIASRPTWQRRLLLVLCLVGIVLLNLVATPRADLALYPGLRMALVLVGLGALGLLASRLALRPLHEPPTGSAGWVGLVALCLIGPLGVGLVPVAHLEHASNFEGQGQAFIKMTRACFIFGTLFALMIFSFAWLCDRSPRPYRRTSAALLAAALGGIAGNLALQIHCPITEQAHILLGHATVGIALVAALALARGLTKTASA